MKKKYIAIVLGIVIGATGIISGCGSTGTAEAVQEAAEEVQEEAAETPAAEAQETAEPKEEETAVPAETKAPEAQLVSAENLTGKVVAVDGNTLTIERENEDGTTETVQLIVPENVTVTSGGMQEMPEGEMPEMPEGEMPEMPEGEMPEMPEGEMPDGEPPEMPSGDGQQGEMPEMPEGEMPDGEPPEMPSGDGQQGEMPEMPGGGRPGMGQEMSLDDLEEGDEITVSLDEDGNVISIQIGSGNGGQDGNGGPGGMQGGPGMSDNSSIEYVAVKTVTSEESMSAETVASTGTDENAILVEDGGSLTAENVTVTRTSDDSTGGDSASFYGVGAAVLATGGTVRLSGGSVETDAAGGAGVFAYGDGVAYVSDVTIHTEQGTSGGIHVAGGGTLYAKDLTVETEGGSSAAIRSDRGSGTMVVDGGSYTSNGSGSPAIYSTADITVHDAELTATDSEAVCIEGLNSIRLYDCDLTGNMPENEQNDCDWNVILYQSMSGDSEEGNSTFVMSGGTLTAENGGMFYTTNTESTFVIEEVDITYADGNDFFLKVTGNSNARGWGQSGANGADCSFTAIDQEMQGDVIWDSISTLDFYMTDGSTLTGAVIDDESNAGNGGSGTCSLAIDGTSTWIVTADSTLTNLSCEGTIVDESGKTVTIAGTDGTVYVQGDSSITVTVGSYSDTADTSDAQETGSWEDYEVSWEA